VEREKSTRETKISEEEALRTPLEAQGKVFQDKAKLQNWNRARETRDPPYHLKLNPDLVPGDKRPQR